MAMLKTTVPVIQSAKPLFFWWLLALTFAVAAAVFNYLRLPLFFGVEFIFGSAVAVLSIALLGVKVAIFVGLAAAVVTWFIWGHPYAVIVFTLEIIWLCWRWRTIKSINLVLQDLLFWLLLGLPIVMILYVFALGVDWQTTINIWLKQMTNGVFNALLAVLIIMALQTQQQLVKFLNLPQLSLKQLLFNSMMALTFLAGAVPLVLNAQQLQREYEQNVEQRLQLLADIAQQQLSSFEAITNGAKEHLTTLLPDNDSGLVILNSNAVPVFSVGKLLAATNAQLLLQSGFTSWQPADAIALQRLRQTRYVFTQPLLDNDDLAFIRIEQGSSDVVAKLQRDSTRQLLLLVGFMLLAILLSIALSRAISAPFQRLTLASKNLKLQIADGNSGDIPQSNLAEYNVLANVLSNMSVELGSAFNKGKTLQAELTEQLAYRNTELQQTNSRLEAILGAASDFSIIATNVEGVITYFSPGAEKLLGYGAAELVNQQTPALFHVPAEVMQRAEQLTEQMKQPISGFQAFVVLAEQQGSESRQWHYVRKDGQTVLVQLTVTPIINGDGNIEGYLGIAKDISERQRNEKLKNEFISTVSHELRTPLTSIYGSLRMVNSGVLAPLPPKIAKLLQVAEANSKRLTVLINDLLDMEKLLAGKMQLELKAQVLAPLIHEALQTINSYAEQYQVRMSVDLPDAPLSAKVDAARFIQVLHNLLSNAIKFSTEKTAVIVRLSQQGSTIKLEVIDQGAGIADAFKTRIFERFSQSDGASTRQQGGTGLGLAISKELTEQMGGEIGFDSTPGQGSTFWLIFPANLTETVS